MPDNHTLAEVNGHVITTDEKLLRIETVVDALAADVKTLIAFVEALIGSAKSARDNAPGFMKGMFPDIPELNRTNEG